MKVEALFVRVFQVAFSSATIAVARNQMQPVMMDIRFVSEQRLLGCALCEKIVRFGS
jgi:hypothetical protein